MSTATHQGTSEKGGQPSFPKVLSYVGVIWIVFGAINLIAGVLAPNAVADRPARILCPCP